MYKYRLGEECKVCGDTREWAGIGLYVMIDFLPSEMDGFFEHQSHG